MACSFMIGNFINAKLQPARSSEDLNQLKESVRPLWPTKFQSTRLPNWASVPITIEAIAFYLVQLLHRQEAIRVDGLVWQLCHVLKLVTGSAMSILVVPWQCHRHLFPFLDCHPPVFDDHLSNPMSTIRVINSTQWPSPIDLSLLQVKFALLEITRQNWTKSIIWKFIFNWSWQQRSRVIRWQPDTLQRCCYLR